MTIVSSSILLINQFASFLVLVEVEEGRKARYLGPLKVEKVRQAIEGVIRFLLISD